MFSTKTSSRFELFDTEEHRAWKADRALRHRAPLAEAWRGCVGLAVLLDCPDNTQSHGDLALVRNEQLTWLALRDVPVGHFPGSAVMNRRDVHYANGAVAELRYGMPVIDFRRDARNAVDFRFMPFAAHVRRFGPKRVAQVRPAGDTLDSGHRQREFAVLNRVSATMTRFAFFASDERGRPVRPAWAANRPKEGERFQAVSPTEWMPRPYLAFPAVMAGDLYRLVTQAEARDTAWECVACHAVVPGTKFQRSGWTKVQVLEQGDFVATCVHCRHRHKWRLADGWPCRVRRQFPRALREGFCRAVAEGVPLRAVGPEVYCGPVRSAVAVPSDDEGVPLDLVPHALKSELDGRKRVVHIPRTATIRVGQGRALDAGDVWVNVLDAPSRTWLDCSHAERWATCHEACGGPGMAAHLLKLWFEHRLVRLAVAPDQVLVPAELVASLARDLRPLHLWWDTAPALAYYDWQAEAAVLPPLHIRYWNRMCFSLPGDVAMEASIVDPRCKAPKVIPAPRLCRVRPSRSSAGTAAHRIRRAG